MGWSDFTDFISDGISQDKTWLGLSKSSSDDSSDDSTTPTSLSGLWAKLPSSTQQFSTNSKISFVKFGIDWYFSYSFILCFKNV